MNDFRLHFGLGDEVKAAVDVRWISGRTDRFESVSADRLIVIREGEGIVRAETMPAPQGRKKA